MNGYGLTEKEQQLNVHKYNHALFRNMMTFMDACWEINLQADTVVMLDDRICPEYAGKQFLYSNIYEEYLQEKVDVQDKEKWEGSFSPEILRKLSRDMMVDIRLIGQDGVAETHRVILSPVPDESGMPWRVYLSIKNMEADLRVLREMKTGLSNELVNLKKEVQRTLSKEEQYRQAVISGAIMVYNINVSRNLIEDEFFEVIDGKRIPMIASLGMDVPCDFEDFSRKWAGQNIPKEECSDYLRVFNRNYLLNCYEEGKTGVVHEYHTKDARNRYVMLKHTLLLTKDEESGDIIARCNAKDITQQYVKEQMLRDSVEAASSANRAKSDFLSRMSHDFRTPLNAIIGLTAVAGTHLEDKEKVDDCLKKIKSSGEVLLTLLNEMLDMSKIGAGELELDEALFSLPELLDNLIAMTRPMVEERHHTFLVNLRPLEHPMVVADSFRIQQVFVNLMSNAVKYTPAGGRIVFTFSERVSGRPNIGCYEIVIEDNGIGMQPEFVKHIFDTFARGTDTRINTVQGSGLGMTITKNIVEMMDGDIRVESTPDIGSKFTATIYLRIADEKENSNGTNDGKDMEQAFSSSMEADFSGRRVLVVEDNDINAEIAEEFLHMVGLSTERASNGKEAVDMVEASPERYYDLVLMDIQMPVMNGNDATRAIRALPRPEAKTMPILAMTANAFAEDVQAVLSAGMNEHVAKPLDVKKLIAALNRWLSVK